MEVHNATLVDLLSTRFKITAAEANVVLMGRIKVLKRKADGRTDTMLAYRYPKRTASLFYEGLGRAAVKSFMSSVNESTGMGASTAVRGSKTRTVKDLPANESAFLLEGDRY